MKEFQIPAIQIVIFSVEDIVTVSTGNEFPLEPFSYEENELPVSGF